MSQHQERTFRHEVLWRELERLGASALLVNAGSSREPDAAALLGPGRIGRLVVVAPRNRPLSLACFSPLDRGEAAETGLEVIPTSALGLKSTAGKPAGEALATALENVLSQADVAPGLVAVTGRAAAGALHEACRQLEAESGGAWRFDAGEELMRRARKSKTPAEVAEIRRVAGLTCDAFRRLATMLAASQPQEDGELWLGAERLRIGRLRSAVAEVLGSAGLEQPEGNILAPAEEGAVPHNSGVNERVLRLGDSLVVDLFPRGHLFADCTRTFCVGEPSKRLTEAWASVHRALDWSHDRAPALGTTGAELQRGVCDLLEQDGWPTLRSDPETETGYVHSLGHGVGYELHELPGMRSVDRGEGDRGEGDGTKGDAGDGESDSSSGGSSRGEAPKSATPKNRSSNHRPVCHDHTIEVGDVITLEPGLYHPEEGWAVRLEDLVYIGPDGPENLTLLPYDLDPRAW